MTHFQVSEGCLRRSRVLKDARAAQAICFGVDDAERQGVEADLPFALIGFFDADGLAGERGRNADELAAPFDLAVEPHFARHGVFGIVGLGEPVGQEARRRRIEPRRRLLAERLVRALEVVFAQEDFERKRDRTAARGFSGGLGLS